MREKSKGAEEPRKGRREGEGSESVVLANLRFSRQLGLVRGLQVRLGHVLRLAHLPTQFTLNRGIVGSRSSFMAILRILICRGELLLLSPIPMGGGPAQYVDRRTRSLIRPPWPGEDGVGSGQAKPTPLLPTHLTTVRPDDKRHVYERSDRCS